MAGGFNFGTGTQTAAGGSTAGSGFSFGQTQQQQQQPAATKSLFGTPTSQAQGGFSFGTLGGSTAPAPAATTASGFGFGATPAAAPTATTAAGGFSFGSTPAAAPAATTAAGGFGFGATPAAAPATTAAGGFSFGATPAAAPAATTAAGGFSFGATPAASIASTGLSLGGAAPASTLTGGFNLGTPASTAASGFSFGGLGGTVATSAPTTGFSLGGASLGGATLGGGLGGVQTTAATTTTTTSTGLGGVGIGLGGAQPPSANADSTNAGVKSDGKPAKEQMLTQDLFATIALFETRRDTENTASEDNIRQTAGPFHKVISKAEEVQQQLGELSAENHHLRQAADSLKADVRKEADNVEMARRTKDTPMALQGENSAPEAYFVNLVRFLEEQMVYCRTKIEEVALCMQAANNLNQTPDDVSEVLQREHETLKELAAKVYAKHSQLVELGQRLHTAAQPSDQGFFRPHSKEGSEAPPSSVVRPALGNGSGLTAFQEQQQRAKAVMLGAAPPTMPLAQTSTSSLFGTNANSSLFSGNKSFFGNTSSLGMAPQNNTFLAKPFGTSLPFGGVSGLGNTTAATQPSSSFAFNSPFTPKPFGDEDGDGRRKRRL